MNDSTHRVLVEEFEERGHESSPMLSGAADQTVEECIQCRNVLLLVLPYTANYRHWHLQTDKCIYTVSNT
jgi:hypothetical protein